MKNTFKLVREEKTYAGFGWWVLWFVLGCLFFLPFIGVVYLALRPTKSYVVQQNGQQSVTILGKADYSRLQITHEEVV